MKKNIVLIGMPGSGKSTIGRLLSKKLQVPFVDLDKEIENYSKQSIPELFERGELYFRDVESEVTKIYSEKTPLIIATGGGVVLRKENMDVLHNQGVIFFLNRDIENIAADIEMNTRPLLKEGLEKLRGLYKERKPLYHQYADYIIDNNEGPEQAINQIIKVIEKTRKGD